MNPLVSAIIPTHHRPGLVQRALRSVLQQTYANLEVIIVVDGPELATVKMLEDLREPRLHIVSLIKNVGNAEAKNIGVREAKGEWIAFLDDDDEWLPEKIEKQIAALTHADPNTNFVACRYEAINNDYKQIGPRRFPRLNEDWGEYLYCQYQALLPSTYFVKKELMLLIPFTTESASNDDGDWLLRAHASQTIIPRWMDDALTIYHCENANCVSKGCDWKAPYQWALRHRKVLLTKKAFSYSLLWLCLPRIKQGRKIVYNSLFLLYKAIALGNVDPRFCALFIVQCLCSPKLKHQLRTLFDRLTENVLPIHTRGER